MAFGSDRSRFVDFSYSGKRSSLHIHTNFVVVLPINKFQFA